jgi:uncharacterized protein YjdB
LTTLSPHGFYNVSASLVIYAPTSVVSDYRSMSSWSSYASRIQAANGSDTIIITEANLDNMKSLIAAAPGGVVKVTIADASLLSGTNSGGTDPLHKLYDAIPSGKYVLYDLSECTFTGIGDANSNAYYARTNRGRLASITLPDTLTSIGSFAFTGCSGLTSVTIPTSVTSIGSYAFQNCSGLTSVTIPNSVTSIGSYAFQYCSGLTSVTIPNSVTSIGLSAFQYCNGLTSVTIPDSVTSIGDSAFSGCSGLTTINVDSGNTNYSSQNGVLFNSDKTTLVTYPRGKSGSYTIPNSVISIGSEAFYYCRGLTSVTIPNSVTSIGDRAFQNCSGLTSVTIPDSVTTIGDAAFSGCSSLISVTIGNSVTSIGSYAFQNCSGLTSVTIPDSVTSIGYGAFSSCSGLTSITIPNSVTSIDSSAFYNCSSLTSVTIPDSVTSIGNEAFAYCSGLISVYVLRETTPLTALGSAGFSNTSASLVIYVPASVVDDYKGMSGWSTYADRIQAILVDVTGVSLNTAALSLAVGANETLTATVAPSNATNTGLSWTTSVEAVATVSNGVVSAIGVGTATITVTTADGGKTASADVTVIPAGTGKITFTFTGPEDENISLGTNNTISWASNDSLTLTVADIYSSCEWYVDGILVSGETGNTLTLLARNYDKKQHTVTVRVKKADGTPYTKVVTFTVGS